MQSKAFTAMAKVVEMPRANTLTVVDGQQLLNGQPPPEVDPETALPACLKAFVVSPDPKMTVLPNFFSEEECEHLIKMVEGCWMPSLVGGANYKKDDTEKFAKDGSPNKGNVENTVSRTRTSWSCMLRYAQDSVVERLEHRIATIAGLPHGVAQMERMNMVRYAPGECFNEHHDGKFRPRTIFVYLNDLPEGDDEGDTFFPVLGYSFKPRKGTAVMWNNANDDGSKEDSRMVHAGRAPFKGVKYGVNCFTNDKAMRELVDASGSIPLENAAVQRVADLAQGVAPALGDDGKPLLQVYEVVPNLKIKAIPGFLSAAEVEHMLEQVKDKTIQPSGAFKDGTQAIAQLPFSCTPTVEAVEMRMVAVTGESIDNLAMLRVVRPGMKEGMCNRGCGKHSVYVCLGKSDEVFFPRIGIRFQLEPGDALTWTNINWDTNVGREEMRTLRLHRVEDGAEPPIGIDGYFHDNPLRAQQKVRNFVTDEEVYGPNGRPR